ncbi:MAG: alpha/beta hydrolase, partial [Myxococcales bacterium]|nr:alpha/beta hydrolase [Myxococcales bacterium]
MHSDATTACEELDVRGARVTADVAGRGDDVVLCLHGFPDTRRTFRALLPTLARAGHRAVAPTLRGYEPATARGAADVTDLVDDVFATLDALGVARAHLVGHDWGAIVAQLAAAREPARVRSLVSLAIPPLGALPAALARRPTRLLPLAYILGFQLRARSVRALLARDMGAVDALWRRWSPGYELPDAERRALHAALAAPGVMAAGVGYYRDLVALWRPRTRALHALSRRPVRVPALYLAGGRDGCVPASAFGPALAATRFTGAGELQTLAGAGHFLHLE